MGKNIMVIFLVIALAGASLTCSNPATMLAKNQCALDDFRKADAKLNAQWKITYQVFQFESEESAERLRAAQRAWVAYRDAECDAEHWWVFKASLSKYSNITCRVKITVERTRELKKLAEDN